MSNSINIVHKDWLKPNQVMIDDKFYKSLNIKDGQKLFIPEAATASVVKQWHDNPDIKPPTYVQNPDGNVLLALNSNEFITKAMQSNTAQSFIVPKLNNLKCITCSSKDFDSNNMYTVHDYDGITDTQDLSAADIFTYDDVLAKYPEMTTNIDVIRDMNDGETLIMNTNSSEFDIIVRNDFSDNFAMLLGNNVETMYPGDALLFDGSLPINDKGFPDPDLPSLSCEKLSTQQYSDLMNCRIGCPEISVDDILNKPVYEFDREGFKQWLNNLDFTKDFTYDELLYKMSDQLSTGIIYIPDEYQHGIYANLLGGSYSVDEFEKYKQDPAKSKMGIVLHQIKDNDAYIGITDRFDHRSVSDIKGFGFEAPDIESIDLKNIVLSTFTPARRQLILERELELQNTDVPQFNNDKQFN